MLTTAEILKNKAFYQDKAIGCLMGLATGDALANTTAEDPRALTAAPSATAASTAITEFALLTARTLLDNEGQLTVGRVVNAWQNYLIQPGGLSQEARPSLRGAVANLQQDILPPLSGVDNVDNNDSSAAAYIAPIGIMCPGDPRSAARLARTYAQISHHADGLWAAQAVAASVAAAMANGSVTEIIAAGQNNIPDGSWLGRAMARAMRICDGARSVENARDRLRAELWTPRPTVSAEAIPQAYALFRLTKGNLEQALLQGATFGRDANAISAILGALSGAKHGASAIPPAWVEQLRRPSGVTLKSAAQEDIPLLAQQIVELVY